MAQLSAEPHGCEYTSLSLPDSSIADTVRRPYVGGRAATLSACVLARSRRTVAGVRSRDASLDRPSSVVRRKHRMVDTRQ